MVASLYYRDDDKVHIDDENKQMEELMYLEAAEVIEKFPEKSPIFMLSMKRRVYWTAQIVYVGFLGLFLYLGYNNIFQSNYIILIPVFLILGSISFIRIHHSLDREVLSNARDTSALSTFIHVRVRSNHEHILRYRCECFLGVLVVQTLVEFYF